MEGLIFGILRYTHKLPKLGSATLKVTEKNKINSFEEKTLKNPDNWAQMDEEE